MGQNSYGMAYRRCGSASGAQHSLPDHRDCCIAERSSPWQYCLFCYPVRPGFCLTIL